ncbi:MAG TPA: hypothetical protein VMT59_06010 [Gaiellaceae bacterium]|nr:hypothetical protein [Gaiellaceae bacterium]
MAKKFDPKAKAKRQKIFVVVGLVLLAAILAFTLPSTLKQLNPPRTDTAPSPAAAAPAAVTPAPGTLAPPTLAGTGPAPAPAATAVVAGQAIQTDSPVTASTAKLISFNLFVSKDPFVQQVSATGATPTGAATTTGTTPTTPAPPNPPPGGATTSTAPAGPPTSAVISVNGTSETVAVGKTFPAAAPQPFFQLVSVNRSGARIGIAGGSLSNGQNTVTIPVGKTLTLMNTADGTRFTIKVVSVG